MGCGGGGMKCPACGGSCRRDEVDIGVGVQCGPWRCEECAWYAGCKVDATSNYGIEVERDYEQSDGVSGSADY